MGTENLCQLCIEEDDHGACLGQAVDLGLDDTVPSAEAGKHLPN